MVSLSCPAKSRIIATENAYIYRFPDYYPVNNEVAQGLYFHFYR
jgi:hypothetical protein